MRAQAKAQFPGALFAERHICQRIKSLATNTQDGAWRLDLDGTGLTF